MTSLSSHTFASHTSMGILGAFLFRAQFVRLFCASICPVEPSPKLPCFPNKNPDKHTCHPTLLTSYCRRHMSNTPSETTLRQHAASVIQRYQYLASFHSTVQYCINHVHYNFVQVPQTLPLARHKRASRVPPSRASPSRFFVFFLVLSTTTAKVDEYEKRLYCIVQALYPDYGYLRRWTSNHLSNSPLTPSNRPAVVP